MIVADASAIGTFLIPDEAGPFASFASDWCARESILAPAHWHVEIANLIRKAHRRGRLTDALAADAAAMADTLAAGIAIAAAPPITVLIAESARLSLSCHDTAYLLAAKAADRPLLTDDGALRRAAIAEGLTVLLP